MIITLPALPYDRDSLEPFISRNTLDYHYGKHHQTYVNNLNRLVAGTEYEGMELEALIRRSSGGLFNNAAQVWNHTFYWHSMRPAGDDGPGTELATRLSSDFGSMDAFRAEFTAAAMGQFGSGWAWLVQRPDGRLAITTTGNAESPLTTDDKPLLTCDVWEHAYYLDRQNDRAAYLEAWWQLVNWEFAARNASATQHASLV